MKECAQVRRYDIHHYNLKISPDMRHGQIVCCLKSLADMSLHALHVSVEHVILIFTYVNVGQSTKQPQDSVTSPYQPKNFNRRVGHKKCSPPLYLLGSHVPRGDS